MGVGSSERPAAYCVVLPPTAVLDFGTRMGATQIIMQLVTHSLSERSYISGGSINFLECPIPIQAPRFVS